MGVPVFKAFAAGLAYVFTHALTILRITWFPALLLMAVNFYFMSDILDAQMGLFELGPEADSQSVFATMGPMWNAIGAIYLSAAILYPMMIAGVLRQITRGESPRLPFYFQFGRDELRIILATILFFLLGVGIYLGGGILAGLVFLIFSFAAAAFAEWLMVVFVAVGIFGLIMAYIWFMVRMSVLYAANIGERKIGIGESWNLTAGSFWALFLYWALWFMLAIAAWFAYVLVMMPGYLPLLAEVFRAAADPTAADAIERQIFEMQQGIWDLSRPGSWVLLVGGYLGMIANVVFWTVPSGIAYRFLSDPDA